MAYGLSDFAKAGRTASQNRSARTSAVPKTTDPAATSAFSMAVQTTTTYVDFPSVVTKTDRAFPSAQITKLDVTVLP